HMAWHKQTGQLWLLLSWRLIWSCHFAYVCWSLVVKRYKPPSITWVHHEGAFCGRAKSSEQLLRLDYGVDKSWRFVLGFELGPPLKIKNWHQHVDLWN
ncbi:jg26707, partial [Pararge aegeria aegeria]